MGPRLAWGALFAVGWTVVACAGATFVCGDDGDCTLGSVPGRCQPNGACAYPDDACPGGLRYPVGAPEDLAGRCVGEPGDPDSDPEGDEAGSTGVTSWTPVADDAGAGADDAPGTDEGAALDDDGSDDANGDAGTDGGGGDEGDDEAESGEPAAACEQEGEPNDEPASATPLPGAGCSFAASGAIGGQDAIDVWAPEIGHCNGSTMQLIVDGLGSERCLQFRCSDGSTANVSCGGGGTTIGQMWSQCCGSADYVSTIECTSGALELYIVLDGSQVCEDYALSYEVMP